MRFGRRPSPLQRHDWRALHSPLRPLDDADGSPRRARRRRRRFASIDERARQRLPRAALAALAGLELVGLIVLLAGPAWQVRRLEVTGNHRLTSGQVIAQAGLTRPAPILAVDPADVRRRLAGSTWVRSSQVSVELPDLVRIDVEEWQPVATYRAGGGRPYYLSDQAVALGPAGSGDGLLDIQGPARPEPRVGSPALDVRLLTALVNIQRSLPSLIGQRVQSYTIDGCGNLTLNASRGWRAQFGRVLTPEEFAALRDKVAALKAVAAGGVDFDSPRLVYVNVMNPTAVAVDDGTVHPSPSPAALRAPGGRAGRSKPSPTPAATPPPAACG